MKPILNYHTRLSVLTLLAALACGAQCSLATLLFYEPFNYPNGTQFGKDLNTNGWNVGNSTGTGSDYANSAAALTYSGLVTQPGSGGLVISGTPGSNRNVGNTNFPAQSLSAGNPATYLSFLLNAQSPTTITTTRMLVALGTGTGSTPAVAVGVCIDSANRLYVAKTSFTPEPTPTPALSAGTHLIVLRYLWNNNDHVVGLWVDPANFGAGETNVPPANATSSANDNIESSIKTAYISQQTNYSGTYYIDELRVGTTWSDVTPSANYQPVSATNSILSISPAATNINKSVLVTVTEYDPSHNAMTNTGVTPVLSASAGTLGTVTALGNGTYTATLTAAIPGYVSVSGTISGTPIGNGAGVSAYFAGTIGTNGIFNFSPGFFPGTYAINFNADPGQIFSVHSSTDLALPLANWTLETDLAIADSTTMSETTYPGSPSSYSFTVQPPAGGQIFYRVSSP